MSAISKRSNPSETAKALFLVNAAIWLLIGVATLARTAAIGSGQLAMMLLIAILMFGNVGAMVVASIGIGKRKRWAFYFGCSVLLVNIVLTFTDQFGFLDLITVVFDLLLLGLLVVTRSHYLAAR